MHIAICDDNVADRKHLERLLSRESDKRAGTPNILYVDSYGDKDNFLQNPQKYNLIFMDMTSTPTIAEEIITKLVALNVTAPIVMYSSCIDYTTNPHLPDSIIHMKKPYIPDPLPKLLELGDAHVIGNIETVPLHCDNEEKHIPVQDIYCFAYLDKKNILYLKNGSFITIAEDIEQLSLLLQPYLEFTRISKTVLVNMKHVALITPFTIMMQDYQEFHYSPLRYKEMKQQKAKIDQLA